MNERERERETRENNRGKEESGEMREREETLRR